MNEIISPSLRVFFEEHKEEHYELLKTLTLIPAPSHCEEARAAFIHNWLCEIGAEGVYIDKAKNVVFPYGCEGKNDLVIFAAHTDTVFPMETSLRWTDDGEKLYCPGVGDDTACVAVILMVIKYLLTHQITPKNGILFVLNSCEEGLGNLKGTRQVFEDYKDRVERFYTYDGYYTGMHDRAVGSHRYCITVETVGGHSWARFGNRNAIQVLSSLVGELYAMEVPVRENTRTTYNVGTIEGGTSVNTIAQNAQMLFEYRSNDPDCLAAMTAQFEEKLEKIRAAFPDATLSVETVGVRPCGKVNDVEKHEAMIARVCEVCSAVAGLSEVPRTAGSTDCNIPLSLGIPALSVGVCKGGGSHTREEWVDKDSLEPGFFIGARLILDYCNE